VDLLHYARRMCSISDLLCSFIEKFFLEIESHVSLESISFPIYFYQDVCDIFYIDKDYGKSLVSRFVSKPEELLKLLVSCPEQQIRKTFQMMLLGSFKRIKEDNEDKLIVDLINVLIEFIGADLTSNWRRFKEFFELLRDLIISLKEDILKAFIEKDLIAILLDFFLEKKSPVSLMKGQRSEMKMADQHPDFSILMEIVAFLVVRSDIPISNAIIVSPSTKRGNIFITLPELSMKCLRCKNLLPKYLSLDNNIHLITDMLLHLSYRNKKITRQICEQIVKGINNSNVNKILQYKDIISQMLLLEDEYSLMRIELILGFSQPTYSSKYGLALIRNIEDEVNTYSSPIAIEDRNKPLLRVLWDDRKYFQLTIVKLLKMLLTAAESNQLLYLYLRDMPPPCYIYARYTDWIDKFLDEYMNQRTSDQQQLKEKNDLINSLRQQVHLFNERVLKDKARPIQLYMIGNTVGSRELEKKEREMDRVRLTVTEITAEIYESKPLGNYNAALSGDYLIDYFHHFQSNANTKHEQKAKENKKRSIERYEEDKKRRQRENDLMKTKDKPRNTKNRNVKHIGSYHKENKGVSALRNAKKERTVFSNKEELKITVIEPDNPSEFNSTSSKDPEYKTLAVLHRIDIVSDYNDKMKVTLSIKPKADTPNFYCPISEFKFKPPHFSSPIFFVQANDITQPIGDYEINMKVKNLDARKIEQKKEMKSDQGGRSHSSEEEDQIGTYNTNQ